MIFRRMLRSHSSDKLATTNMLFRADDSALASEFFYPEITECCRARQPIYFLGADAICPAELRWARTHEVIYESVVDVKSFFRQTLTATPERLGYCVARLFAL